MDLHQLGPRSNALDGVDWSKVDIHALVDAIGPDNLCKYFKGVVDCNSFLAPMVISGLVNMLVTGIIITQAAAYTWLYYCRGFSRSGTLMLVWISTLLQMVSMVAEASRMSHVFGYGFGSYQGLLIPRREDAVTQVCHTSCQLLAQFYLLYKAWYFFKATSILKRPGVIKAFRVLCAFLGAAIILSFAAGCAVAAEIQIINNYMLLALKGAETRVYNMTIPMWLAPSTLVDITLTFVIFWELYLPKDERSDKFSALHDRIIKYLLVILQSGVVLACLQAATLIAWQYQLLQSNPLKWSSWIYLPQLLLGKYYTVNLLLVVTIPHIHKLEIEQDDMSCSPTYPQDPQRRREHEIEDGGAEVINLDYFGGGYAQSPTEQRGKRQSGNWKEEERGKEMWNISESTGRTAPTSNTTLGGSTKVEDRIYQVFTSHRTRPVPHTKSLPFLKSRSMEEKLRKLHTKSSSGVVGQYSPNKSPRTPYNFADGIVCSRTVHTCIEESEDARENLEQREPAASTRNSYFGADTFTALGGRGDADLFKNEISRMIESPFEKARAISVGEGLANGQPAVTPPTGKEKSRHDREKRRKDETTRSASSQATEKARRTSFGHMKRESQSSARHPNPNRIPSQPPSPADDCLNDSHHRYRFAEPSKEHLHDDRRSAPSSPSLSQKRHSPASEHAPTRLRRSPYPSPDLYRPTSWLSAPAGMGLENERSEGGLLGRAPERKASPLASPSSTPEASPVHEAAPAESVLPTWPRRPTLTYTGNSTPQICIMNEDGMSTLAPTSLSIVPSISQSAYISAKISAPRSPDISPSTSHIIGTYKPPPPRDTTPFATSRAQAERAPLSRVARGKPATAESSDVEDDLLERINRDSDSIDSAFSIPLAS